MLPAILTCSTVRRERLMQLAVDRLFPALDVLDAVGAKGLRALKKATQLAVVTGLAVYWVQAVYVIDQYNRIKDTDGWIESGSAHHRLAVMGLHRVLDSFVWHYPLVHRLLVAVLCSNVFKNDRIAFMLAVSVGRVVESNSIQTQLKTLTKDGVLKDSVLYSPEIYGAMKALLVRQLRTDTVVSLIQQQTVNFSKSETAIGLAAEQLGDTLRLKKVIESFSEGVVDKAIYSMLESKENARKLDNQLYEILK